MCCVLCAVWCAVCGVRCAGAPMCARGSVQPVVTGKKHICLAISEPWAGSDVSAIRTSAAKTPDGKAYVVSGEKKWITGGMMADYFMTAVRTGDEGSGAAGISLLCINRHLPGVSVRKMETQFDNSHVREGVRARSAFCKSCPRARSRGVGYRAGLL